MKNKYFNPITEIVQLSVNTPLLDYLGIQKSSGGDGDEPAITYTIVRGQ